MDISKRLFKAAKQGNIATVKELIEVPGCDINAMFRLKYSNSGAIDCWSALHVAANNGHDNIVQILLGHGAKVNATTLRVGSTPLHQAAACNWITVIDTLLRNGADLSINNKKSTATPLHAAAMFGSSEAIYKLVKGGAGINAETADHGATALHISAAYGQYDCVKALLQNGANINMENKYSETPAHLAAWYGHADILRLLIYYACDVTMEDQEGRTVRECIQISDRYDNAEARYDVIRLIDETTNAQEVLLTRCIEEFQIDQLDDINDIIDIADIENDRVNDSTAEENSCYNLANGFREKHGRKSGLPAFIETLQQDGRFSDVAEKCLKWYSTQISTYITET